ncbi:MAG: PilZ domain-containing protein [Candidatus Aminicenantes bacterium]|nr:PilZ domain-containing protein [Candidatus Aminicenantes bacterium]
MKKIRVPVDINRRREWRFELPLTAIVEGTLPQGKNFKEVAKLENISSTGAYLCLDSGVVVGSKLNIIIELPKELTESQGLKLQIGGMTVRLEKPNKKNKKQGVAVRFDKEFKFIRGSKK